ncbi:MAG: bifunctional indole-3-glycerol-phosphate synthase TrpC/phosphoribosylanthranilate isomerase TrpF [Desulfobacteraceae bacterium]|nr:bifunctional indole-3-glycerol-phosphate synthase TrpC/phosphoribosylanthranilate isomerase TrpF [Desulfobacteraceae bacterium]
MAVKGFLKEIRAIKQKEVAQLAARTGISHLRQQAEEREHRANFRQALEASSPSRAGIIAEIKKASPSKGPIRPDLDPFEMARAYTEAGAAAISVLTESNYFLGTMEDLGAARRASDRPILRKDFIFSEIQIYESRAAGADSLLLITTLLDPGELRDYICLARELCMEPLVEINSEWEFETALRADAAIIGINNRNLATLETDLNVAQRLAPFFTGQQIPVAASGISERKDIQAGIDAGIVNFLVGESIVRAPDTRAFIHDLLGEPAEAPRTNDNSAPLVKICGLTDPHEARECVELGADAIGLVFYEKSPRNISIDQARRITGRLPESTLSVGVFVNADHDYIMERITACDLKAVQLHGRESPELVTRLTRSGVRVIKALFAERQPGFDTAGAYADAWGFLVEHGGGSLPGGNALPWEWDRAGEMEEARRLILAGGLDPDNVQQAVAKTKPFMVDVSSGVERSFGKKDLARVAQFIHGAKGRSNA